MLGVSEGSEIVNGYGEVIGIAPVHVSLDVEHRAIRVNGAGDGSRRSVVVDDPRKVRPGQILQPSRSRSVCQARVRRADHIGLISIASHELIPKKRGTVDTARCAPIVVWIGPGGCRIIDRSWPVAEVPRPFLGGGKGITWGAGRTPQAETLVIYEEIALLPSGGKYRELDRPADVSAKVVLLVYRSVCHAERTSVKVGVPEQLVNRAVKSVCAGLCDGRQHRRRRVAVLRVVIRRQQRDFLNCLRGHGVAGHGQFDTVLAERPADDGDAVQQGFVRLVGSTVNPRIKVQLVVVTTRCHARQQPGKCDGAARVAAEDQREFLQRFRLDGSLLYGGVEIEG